MEIYLVRHGKAEPGPDDDLRQLTPEGRARSERTGSWLAARNISPDRIESSPLLRAAQTARCIAEALHSQWVEMPDLGPMGDVSQVYDRIANEGARSVMLVGHNPFLEALAGLMIAGDLGVPVLTFHTGSVARLVAEESGSAGRFSCDWLVKPRLLQ